jgi:hypothetical protein
MYFKSAFTVLPAIAAIAMAAAVAPKQACWTGEIHSPCLGFTTGCTPDGIKVCHENIPITVRAFWLAR